MLQMYKEMQNVQQKKFAPCTEGTRLSFASISNFIVSVDILNIFSSGKLFTMVQHYKNMHRFKPKLNPVLPVIVKKKGFEPASI